jgi:hypothetical protein
MEDEEEGEEESEDNAERKEATDQWTRSFASRSRDLCLVSARRWNPRDGLTLFGPLRKGKPYGIRAGVIGTSTGISPF